MPFLVLFFCVALNSCKSAPTDLRTLAPAETLIYLEANDTAQIARALTENEAWKTIAKDAPDFSALAGTQLAIAVTGFETSENQLADDAAILNFKPHFVAILETHAWKMTAVSIAEKQLGKLAAEIYDDVKLEKSEKRDEKWFVWTAADGRRLFAAVSQSVIYFGNDDAAIEKCLAVRRGETENLTTNQPLADARLKAENALAFGYVSPAGVAQISNLIGVKFAADASEQDAPRAFIARVLPPFLQKTTSEISWTARKTERGIEDKFSIKTDANFSRVLKETIVSGGAATFQTAEFLPPDAFSVTRYNLQNPQIAWRGLLLASAGQMDAADAKILLRFAGTLFEPYGIADAETFLSGTGAEIVTAKFDDEGEKSVAIVEVKDAEELKKSVAVNFKSPPEKIGAADVWKTDEIAAAFIENKLILGDAESVLNCLKARESGQSFAKTEAFQKIAPSQTAAATLTKDAETAAKIVALLDAPRDENKNYAGFYTTETRFTSSGIERKTVSDFGVFGAILENLSDEK